MLRSLFIVLIYAVVIFGVGGLSFAQAEYPADEQVAETNVAVAVSGEVVNVGNKICPVSGEKIDEKLKVTYEYQDKVYNFCCAGCISSFKADPDKYIKIVNEELSKESEVSEK